jgi:hypothetical protein
MYLWLHSEFGIAAKKLSVADHVQNYALRDFQKINYSFSRIIIILGV